MVVAVNLYVVFAVFSMLILCTVGYAIVLAEAKQASTEKRNFRVGNVTLPLGSLTLGIVTALLYIFNVR
jgi:hypothetical protein